MEKYIKIVSYIENGFNHFYQFDLPSVMCAVAHLM